MNIYLISQRENTGYDTYDSAVVVAESEDAARQITPGATREDSKWEAQWTGWCSSPDHVNVEFIGTTELHTTPGIILASYNAG